MKDLEKFIVDHRDEIDSTEPYPGHFQRFERRLASHPVASGSAFRPSLMLKIAAIILLMITVSVLVFDMASREISHRFASREQRAELPIEIRQAVQYYSNQTDTQLSTLNKLAAAQHEPGGISETAVREIRDLDAATAELKKLLDGNPGNERILDAIIQNQQMKESVLNTIISRVSQQK